MRSKLQEGRQQPVQIAGSEKIRFDLHQTESGPLRQNWEQGAHPVLSWVSETVFHVISWMPNWLYADDTPRYFIVRGMLGLGLLVLVILAFALWRNWRLRDQAGERR